MCVSKCRSKYIGFLNMNTQQIRRGHLICCSSTHLDEEQESAREGTQIQRQPPDASCAAADKPQLALIYFGAVNAALRPLPCLSRKKETFRPVYRVITGSRGYYSVCSAFLSYLTGTHWKTDVIFRSSSEQQR